jgi:hypothetical protein
VDPGGDECVRVGIGRVHREGLNGLVEQAGGILEVDEPEATPAARGRVVLGEAEQLLGPSW